MLGCWPLASSPGPSQCLPRSSPILFCGPLNSVVRKLVPPLIFVAIEGSLVLPPPPTVPGHGDTSPLVSSWVTSSRDVSLSLSHVFAGRCGHFRRQSNCPPKLVPNFTRAHSSRVVCVHMNDTPGTLLLYFISEAPEQFSSGKLFPSFCYKKNPSRIASCPVKGCPGRHPASRLMTLFFPLQK